MFQRYLVNCAVCAVVLANGVAAAQNPLENGASFTPEGTIIHHWHDRQTGGLVEIDLEGNRLREITATTHQDRWPKVGANGREIVFVSTRDGTWSVFAVAREGGEVRQITDNYVMNLGGAVSPDGEWLLVAQNRQQEEFYSDIFLSRPDGSARRRIVEGGMWPNWLADGSGFIFTRDNGESGALDVILYRLADGQEIRLTEVLRMMSPRWSHRMAAGSTTRRVRTRGTSFIGARLRVVMTRTSVSR